MNWRPYAQLARLPAIFSAFADILATHFIVTGGDVRLTPLVSLLIASGLIYSAGMVLNDCFDLEIDRRERPYRPLPSGAVSMTTAWLLGAGMMMAGVTLAFTAGTASGLSALALAALVLAYDGWAKNGLLGPPVMGLCRYANWIMGLSILPLTTASWLLPIPILLYVTGVTILSGQEVEARQRGAVIAAALVGGLSFPAMALLVRDGTLPHAWALLAGLPAFALLMRTYIGVYRDFSPQSTQAAMRTLLMGIAPLGALVTLAAAPPWTAVVVLLLTFPGKWLARRMYVS
ncbi:MAG: UbiA family prenyltransferase [Gammaproteobacteria bacterium]